MKRIYIKPTAKAQRIEIESIMNITSQFSNELDNSSTATKNDVEGKKHHYDLWNSTWDDDEEDE